MSTKNFRQSLENLNSFGLLTKAPNSTKSLTKILNSPKALIPSISRLNPHSELVGMEGYVPQWLLKRKDFQEFLKKDQGCPQKILESMSKPCHQRSIIDNQNTVNWLQHCKLSKKIKVASLLKLSKNVQIKIFPKGHKFTQESLKDQLFILVLGAVGIFNGELKSSVLKPKDHFGHFNGLKPHNHYTCLTETKLASFDSSLLSEISYSVSQRVSNLVFKILNSQEVFCGISQSKLMLLSERFMKTEYDQNDLVFEENEKCENFFIVKSGKIQIQKTMTLTKRHKLPIQQVLISKKQYNHVVRTLEKGAVFALEELVEAKNFSCTAKALTDASIYCINRKDFFEIIDSKDRDTICKGFKNKFPVTEIKQGFMKSISNSVRRIKTIIETVEKTDRVTLRNDKKKGTWAQGARDYYNSISSSQFIGETIEFKDIFPLNTKAF